MSLADRSERAPPPDQAHGLRRLFAQPLALVPVVANPHMPCSGVLIERLCAALGAIGTTTLVVDAADNAPPADELATMDLAHCVEPLTPTMSYLAARALPLRYVDARGSTAGFLQAVLDAAPQAGAVLVHGSASDLARMFARQTLAAQVVPLLLADDRPASVTHAYAALKWLALRARLHVFHLLLEIDPASPRAARIAEQIGRCADRYVGALLRDCSVVDPAGHAAEAPPASLRQLARTLVAAPHADGGAAARVRSLALRSSQRAAAPAIEAVN